MYKYIMGQGGKDTKTIDLIWNDYEKHQRGKIFCSEFCKAETLQQSKRKRVLPSGRGFSLVKGRMAIEVQDKQSEGLIRRVLIQKQLQRKIAPKMWS